MVVVYHEVIIQTPIVPVVETKYWYPEIPTQVSLAADRYIVNAPVAAAPLVGLVSVGMLGAVVSR